MRDTTKELNHIVAAAHAGEKLHLLADKVLQLQTADKFRLAASLLDLGQVNVAVTIGKRALDEIKLARLLGQPKEQPSVSEPIQHGRTCQKVPHGLLTGWLHGEDDDTPYDIDGVTYCGRCHMWLPS